MPNPNEGGGVLVGAPATTAIVTGACRVKGYILTAADGAIGELHIYDATATSTDDGDYVFKAATATTEVFLIPAGGILFTTGLAAKTAGTPDTAKVLYIED
jgi:hypothetical protein